MEYKIKNCIKNEKYKGKELYHFSAMTITKIEAENRSGNPITIPAYAVLDRQYQVYKGYHHFEISYVIGDDSNKYHDYDYNFLLSEEETNRKTIIIRDGNFDLNEYLGIEIVKGTFSSYNSYDLFPRYKKEGEYRYDGCERDYALKIDAPLKELFLYNRTVSNFFIEKTVPILKEFVKALKKSSNVQQAKECMDSMNQYLMTTLETVKELSKKTDCEALEIIRKQSETEKFLENMRYRNDVAKLLQNC